MTKKRIKKIGYMKMLWERKHFYLMGMILPAIVSYIAVKKEDMLMNEAIAITVGLSFIFGHFIYRIIKESDALKKEGRASVFSRESMMNFALGFGSMILLGILFKGFN